MNKEEIIEALRECFLQQRRQLYGAVFRRKLAAVSCHSPDWYHDRLEEIEAVTGIVEGCLLSGDLGRAARYIAAMHIMLDRLREKTDRECKALLQKHGVYYDAFG